MRGLKYIWLYLLLSGTIVLFTAIFYQPLQAAAPQNSGASSASQQPERDGQHDFDFNFGTWKTHISRLQHPLTASTTWVEYEGTSVIRKVWNGRANLFELEATGPAGRIEGLGLRLYNPESHQWSLNWANSASGAMTTPNIGEFKNGRGDFLSQDTLNGRAIYVRNSFLDITPDSSRFEQAFSNDGGKTWEINWIMTFTRISEESDEESLYESSPQSLDAFKAGVQTAERDGQHDFDFEIGRWKTHLSRLQHPLTGSTSWTEYDGTSMVRKVWNGRANLVELEIDGPTGHIEGLSLRLYNSEAHQWSLNFANSKVGTLSQPTIGQFKNRRGEFFDTEPFNGRNILVRQVWSDMTPSSGRFEQAFSEDGGKTWEVNWMATDTRVSDESDKAQ